MTFVVSYNGFTHDRCSINIFWLPDLIWCPVSYLFPSLSCLKLFKTYYLEINLRFTEKLQG